jgi:hypothetical protein
LGGRYPVERLLGRPGLTHDGEILLCLQEVAQAAPHDLVVVEEENFDGQGL